MTDRELSRFQNDRANGTHAKLIYGQLREHDLSGYWKVSVDGFRNVLNLPSDMKVTDIRRYVIIPVLIDLREKYVFNDLKCEFEMKERKPFAIIFR